MPARLPRFSKPGVTTASNSPFPRRSSRSTSASAKFWGVASQGVSLWPILELIVARARICLSPRLPEGVCDDPADDKFLACALAGGARVIVSGDKALLRTSGYGGVRVMTPRQFISLYLEKAHSLAEGAGAAPLAAALKLRDRLAGKKVALVLSGGNLSMEQLRRVVAT